MSSSGKCWPIGPNLLDTQFLGTFYPKLASSCKKKFGPEVFRVGPYFLPKFSTFWNFSLLVYLYWLRIQFSSPSLRKMFQVLFMCIYHHHQVALVARIARTLLHHSSLFDNALGRSSAWHPESSKSCSM